MIVTALWTLVQFAIFLAITAAVLFPFYYAVLSSTENGEDGRESALVPFAVVALPILALIFLGVVPGIGGPALAALAVVGALYMIYSYLKAARSGGNALGPVVRALFWDRRPFRATNWT